MYKNLNARSVCFAEKCFAGNIFSILPCFFHCKIWSNLKIFSIDRKILCKCFTFKNLGKHFTKKTHSGFPPPSSSWVAGLLDCWLWSLVAKPLVWWFVREIFYISHLTLKNILLKMFSNVK